MSFQVKYVIIILDQTKLLFYTIIIILNQMCDFM